MLFKEEGFWGRRPSWGGVGKVPLKSTQVFGLFHGLPTQTKKLFVIPTQEYIARFTRPIIKTHLISCCRFLWLPSRLCRSRWLKRPLWPAPCMSLVRCRYWTLATSVNDMALHFVHVTLFWISNVIIRASISRSRNKY